jgi:hypothetical protein
MKITVFVIALLVAGACFTHCSEVDAEIDSEMTTDYPSCVFSNTCAYGCWKALECPPGMSHYGDGSACQGGGRPNCDLSWCWNPNNNKVFIFFPNRAHFHLLIFFPSVYFSFCFLARLVVAMRASPIASCPVWRRPRVLRVLSRRGRRGLRAVPSARAAPKRKRAPSSLLRPNLKSALTYGRLRYFVQ